jgi:hypothetical protein
LRFEIHSASVDEAGVQMVLNFEDENYRQFDERGLSEN